MRKRMPLLLSSVAALFALSGISRPHLGAEVIRASEEASMSPLVLFMAMTGNPGEGEAKEYVESAQKAGFGQIMIYPRTGLELDYMGDEWLSFVDACLKEAKSRGMKVWLYDEYNFPSGSCKGRVPEENPEWGYSEYGIWRNDDGSFRWDGVRRKGFIRQGRRFVLQVT